MSVVSKAPYVSIYFLGIVKSYFYEETMSKKWKLCGAYVQVHPGQVFCRVEQSIGKRPVPDLSTLNSNTRKHYSPFPSLFTYNACWPPRYLQV